jgi:hypothetical protein
MEKRMLDAAAAIPGVTAVGYSDRLPLSIGGGDSDVFTDTTADFRPTNAAADAQNFQVSPDYFRAAGTALLAGRSLTMHDDEKAPVVAVVNREFARKVFGSADKAVGRHFKFWGGSNRAEVIGVVEDGKYQTLTEDPKPAMFFSFLQHGSSQTWLIVRSERDTQGIAAALQRSMRSLDPTLPLEIRTWNSSWIPPSSPLASPPFLSACLACWARCLPLPASSAWPPIPSVNVSVNSVSA